MYGMMPYYNSNGFWMIALLLAMAFGLIAQMKIKSTYARYARVQNKKNITGMQAAREILDRNGLTDVKIVPISGELTDHYDPTKNIIRLSERVYNDPSIASVSIAAHEVGHAIQHDRGYAFLNFRNSLVPVVNFASRSIYPLLLVGLFISPFFINVAIAVFAITVLFQIVTLPVEIDASSRALENLDGTILHRDEVPEGKKVLSAAAMTYIAAALFSLVQLLRIMNSRRDD